MVVNIPTPLATVIIQILAFVITAIFFSHYIQFFSNTFGSFKAYAESDVDILIWLCLYSFGLFVCISIGWLHSVFFYFILEFFAISLPDSNVEDFMAFEFLGDLAIYFFVILIYYFASSGFFTWFFYIQLLFILGLIIVTNITFDILKAPAAFTDSGVLITAFEWLVVVALFWAIFYFGYNQENSYELFWCRNCVYLFIWYCIVVFTFLICFDFLGSMIFVGLAISVVLGCIWTTETVVDQAFTSL